MPFDPASTKREIARLRARQAKLERRIRILERRVRDHAYRELFREVTSKPIDWDRMSLPVGCRPSPSNPDVPITCFVCRRTTTHESYESGGPVPRALGAPSLHVHTACVPKFVLDRWSCD